MSEILWQPDNHRLQNCKMQRFLQAVNDEYSLGHATYQELHAWSVDALTDFWDFYNRQSGILYHHKAKRVLSSLEMPGARWFKGATLNYAENLLQAADDKIAILSKVENRPLASLSYGELRQMVERCARALIQAGITQNDRIAGYLPNIPETVAAMLAAASQGALWSSCSPDFGARGVVERFGQIAPKILITADGYTYNGKAFPLIDTLNALAEQVKGLEHIVVIPFLDPAFDKNKIRFASVFTWEEFLASGNSGSFEYRAVPFDHPLFLMYSSGTTGLPKCIVHGTGGTLLQHHKEHALHTDIGPDDRVFFFTTCGWMMWNWLVSALAQQAAIVLYEGSPGHPSLKALWDLIDEAEITVFGTSPKFLTQNQKQGLEPKDASRFPNLRTILSTGAPLDVDSFRWVYRHVKSDVQLSSISGGTDIISCFMLGNPILPVREGEIQCLGLGMDVVALGADNQPVINRKGELACRKPAPSMPVAFWNDPDQEAYRRAYFTQVPGVWIHGDFIKIKDHGGVLVYGRSDATLNPGGVRIGTAEIYRIVENMAAVLDSLVIGLEEDGDIRMLLFVVPQDGIELDPELKQEIRSTIRAEATPRHVPQEIYGVKEIPKTLNGKKVELTVRDLFLGKPAANVSALANADCLAEYDAIRRERATAPKPKANDPARTNHQAGETPG